MTNDRDQEIMFAIGCVVLVLAILRFIPVDWKEVVMAGLTGIVALARGRSGGNNAQE